MTKTEKLAQSLLKPINPSVIIVLGIYTIVWGLWIFNPFWDVFTVSPLYSTMAGIGSEYIWGMIAIVSGIIICRGAVVPEFNNIQLGSLIGFFHWLVISTLYFIADWHSTAGLSAAAFAIYSGLVWVNTKVNHKTFR